MHKETIVSLLDKAIESGEKCSYELHDIFIDLDETLEVKGKEAVLRYFFDCWSDAVNHDFMVYETRDPSEWADAAKELRNWYLNKASQLSSRELWKEALPKNA